MNLVIDTIAQDNYLISGLCFISLVWILLPIYVKLYKNEGTVIFCACEIKKTNTKDISGLTKYCHQLRQHFAFIFSRHSTSCWTPHRADLSLLIKITIYFRVVMQYDGLILGNNQVSS